jgi:opine dehydrogenase
MVFLADLGRHIGVATPLMDSMIEIASVVMGRDFGQELERTVDGLGLSGYSVPDLASL